MFEIEPLIVTFATFGELPKSTSGRDWSKPIGPMYQALCVPVLSYQ